MVSCPLAARQVYERDLSMHFVLPFQAYLQYGVRTGGISVSAVLGGDSDCSSKGNVLHEVLAAGYLCL